MDYHPKSQKECVTSECWPQQTKFQFVANRKKVVISYIFGRPPLQVSFGRENLLKYIFLYVIYASVSQLSKHFEQELFLGGIKIMTKIAFSLEKTFVTHIILAQTLVFLYALVSKLFWYIILGLGDFCHSDIFSNLIQ